MIVHENRLLADDSHEILCLIFFSKICKDVANLSSAAVVIGTSRVSMCSPEPSLAIYMRGLLL